MELFPASDDTQWELIKRVIKDSDYYIVIVGGRYGSIGANGLSYTEMEYDYALSEGLPVLGFVRERLDEIPFGATEKSDEGRKKLEAFRAKVMSRSCRKFSSSTELGMAVMKSLTTEARLRPRIGWVRADQARSEQDVQREHKLLDALDQASAMIEALERERRDGAVLTDEIPREELAQGSDVVALTVSFQDQEKKHVLEDVDLTWDEIFRAIGSELYGFILKKTRRSYAEADCYSFQTSIEELVRCKLFDRARNRMIKLQSNQIDTCIIQFKELGLLEFTEKKEQNGEIFRGITLTCHGERYLTILNAKRRSQCGPASISQLSVLQNRNNPSLSSCKLRS